MIDSRSIFIRRLNVVELRHLGGLTIPISDSSLKHLIITGKNGSGKTSLVQAISTSLHSAFFAKYSRHQARENIKSWRNAMESYRSQMEIAIDPEIKRGFQNQIDVVLQTIESEKKRAEASYPVVLDINNEELIPELITEGNFLIDVENDFRNNRQEEVQGAKVISVDKSNIPGATVSRFFAQFLTNQRMEMLDNKEENNSTGYESIKKWFVDIENIFKTVFENADLQLRYNSKKKIYEIDLPGRQPFGLHEMSSGFAAYFKLVMELIMRMSASSTNSRDIAGICVIDEIDAHLHVALQRSALPLLTKFFPNIQFIVTTHSPFVVNSVQNAVVYDLENRILISDPTNFSYETITEFYFRTDSISIQLKEKLEKLDSLSEVETMSSVQVDEWEALKMYFKSIEPFLTEDMRTSLKAIQIKSSRND